MRQFLLALLFFSCSGAAHFSWRQCPNAGDTALSVSAINLSPDTIQLNDYTSVFFTSQLTRNVSYPMTLSVTFKKVILFGWEMRIPCLSFGATSLPIGSCEYDVCSSMSYLKSRYGCSSEFVDNNLPCACPFVGGSSYNAAINNPIRLYLDTTGIPSALISLLTVRCTT